jgi:hypothetical protein
MVLQNPENKHIYFDILTGKKAASIILLPPQKKYHIVIITIISGSTLLVRTLTASHRKFRHAVGLLWTSYQSITKASTYTEQHNTTQHRNTKTNIHASIGIRTHDPSNQAAKYS